MYIGIYTRFQTDSVISKNRYSMPVTGSRVRTNGANSEYASTNGLGHINTTGFLFGDDDEASKKESATSPDVKSYLQMNATDDKFPILVRRDDYPNLVSRALTWISITLTCLCSYRLHRLRWIWRFRSPPDRKPK